MSILKSVAALATVGAVLFALPAIAQATAQAGENGIKVGEGRVHPFLDVELRLDSAAIDRGSARGEMLTHIRPGLRMDVPGSSVNLSAAGNADLVLYTGLLTPGTQGASYLGGELNLDLAINQSGPVEFRTELRGFRGDRSTNPALDVGFLSTFGEARLALPIHPGGRALEITPSASLTGELFENHLGGGSGTSPTAHSYFQLGFGLNGRYRFLPKTALVLDADFVMPQYTAGNAEMVLRAAAGVSGLLTQKFAVLAKVGWGHSFTGVGKTLIGHLELAYLASQTASLKLGYLRTLQPIAMLKSYSDDRGYIEGRALMGGRLSVRGYAGLDWIGYEAGDADMNVRVDAGPEYQFTRWLVAGASYVLTMRTTSVAYARHEGYVRFTFTY